MAGDPKFEALAGPARRSPTRATRELLGLNGIRVDDPEEIGERLGRGARRRPARRARGRSPTPKCRRCRRTSRFEQAEALRLGDSLHGDPGRAARSSRQVAAGRSCARVPARGRSTPTSAASRRACTLARALRSARCAAADRARARCRSASRSTSSTTGLASATSGCGRPSSLSPPLSGRRHRRRASERRGEDRAAGRSRRSTASTGWSACTSTPAACARKPGRLLASRPTTSSMGPPILAPGLAGDRRRHGAVAAAPATRER